MPLGRWLSYRTGADALNPVIFVTDLPQLSRRFQIMAGHSCRWFGDGTEMICQNGDSDLVRLDVRAEGSTFERSTSEVLFRLRNLWWEGDRETFVISEPLETQDPGSIDVVVNWESCSTDRHRRSGVARRES